jgi:hypothetical protein
VSVLDAKYKEGIVPDRTARLLWFLFFAPPVTWSLHLGLAYSLHRTACESSSRMLLWLVSAVLILIPIFTGLAAFRFWHSLPDPYAGGAAGAPEEEEPRQRGRERFLAVVAFFFSCLFVVLILGQTVPMVVLRPCD